MTCTETVRTSCSEAFQASYSACTPNGPDEIACCGFKWRKSQLRVIVCCLVTIIILGVLLGDLGKIIGIVGASMFVSLLCCRGVDWVSKKVSNDPRRSTIALTHYPDVSPAKKEDISKNPKPPPSSATVNHDGSTEWLVLNK